MKALDWFRSLFHTVEEPCAHIRWQEIGKVRTSPSGRKVQAMRCVGCGVLRVKPRALRLVK